MAYQIEEECTGCYVCLDKCPENAIIPGEVFKIDPEKCTDCAECVEACPLNVIHYLPEDSLDE